MLGQVSSKHPMSTTVGLRVAFIRVANWTTATLNRLENWCPNEAATISTQCCGGSFCQELDSATTWRRDTSPIAHSIHWLQDRPFKTVVLVWKCVHSVAASYLQSSTVMVCIIWMHSAIRLPRMQTSTEQRSFAFSGLAVLQRFATSPHSTAMSLNSFKKQKLKTYLFG